MTFSPSWTRLSSLTVKVSDRRRDTPESAQNRSDSLCADLWVPRQIFWAWFGPALGPTPARSQRFLAGSFKFVRSLLAQPSGRLLGDVLPYVGRGV